MDGRTDRADRTSGRRSFIPTAASIVAYALAMAYVESAVVVYLDAALSVKPEAIFPLRDPASAGNLAWIELGRELATLVMLATVGWLAGRDRIERLAWTAVAFGVWDIAYYGWLWVFVGWPPSLGTWDLLFLVPVPWVGPVWSPVVVSVALVGFGLAAARQRRLGRPIDLTPRLAAGAVAGGLIVILSFTIDAGSIIAGGVPTSFPWPVFATGMAVAAACAATALRRSPVNRPGLMASPEVGFATAPGTEAAPGRPDSLDRPTN